MSVDINGLVYDLRILAGQVPPSCAEDATQTRLHAIALTLQLLSELQRGEPSPFTQDLAPGLPSDTEYVQRARELYGHHGWIQIDDHPVVSRSGEGDEGLAFVQAWIYINRQDATKEP